MRGWPLRENRRQHACRSSLRGFFFYLTSALLMRFLFLSHNNISPTPNPLPVREGSE